MKKGILSALFTICIWIIPCSAQVMVSPSLKEAIDVALDYSGTIKNQDLELEKAELGRKTVLNKYLPTLSANATYAYLNNDLKLDIPTVLLPVTGTPLFEGSTNIHNEGNVFIAALNAKQVLFSGGQIMNGAKAMGAKNEGTKYLSEIKKDEIVKDIVNSFDQLRLLDHARSFVNESEIRLNKEKQRVEKAIAQGLAVPYDRDKIELASLNLESKKAEIEGKKQLLYIKINSLTGYDVVQIDAVVYTLAPIMITELLDIQHRNELRAMGAFSKALEYNLKKEKGSLLPSIGAFASYGYGSLFDANSTIPLPISGNQTILELNEATLSPNLMVGAQMKWEIFGRMERKHRIESVKIDQKILANKKEDTERLMNLQLRNNMVNYNVQLSQLAIADQKMKIAGNNLITAEKQYKLGLISVTERIVAETDIYEVSLNKVQTLINQRQAALDAYSAAEPLENFIQVK
ncbi:TolC family protein [Flavobacteriaceae bacterium F89]|uniref:TolC family protein n=1 Tax=Cerina litoralis TaxID=2874477 RepID=A0AAE3JQP0_9FLAO|nr:TolC family protein [Cerina litoralis]MCG2460453.1 TolC family protein [Cerina litoralis]